MNATTQEAIGWAVIGVVLIIIVAVLIFAFANPETPTVEPPREEPKPCVCPQPDTPTELPHTGVGE